MLLQADGGIGVQIGDHYLEAHNFFFFDGHGFSGNDMYFADDLAISHLPGQLLAETIFIVTIAGCDKF